MDVSEKRISTDAKNLQVDPHSENKKVCPRCKREFKCGKGLGAHIKVHLKRQNRSNFTQIKGLKMSKRKGCGFFREAAHRRDLDLSKSLVGSGWKVQKKRTFSQVSGGEINDLSKSLVGYGWKVQKMRSSNEVRNKRVFMELDSCEDDYVQSDNEDENYSTGLWEKLRRHDFTSTVHKSCLTRRSSELMCKECKKYFKTYCAVFRYVLENEPINNDVQDLVNEAGGVEVAKKKLVPFFSCLYSDNILSLEF